MVFKRPLEGNGADGSAETDAEKVPDKESQAGEPTRSIGDNSTEMV
jgi:hypothetical protein